MRFSRRLTLVAVLCGGLLIAVPLIALAGSGEHGRHAPNGVKPPHEPQKTIHRSVRHDVSRPLRTIAPAAPKVRAEAPENRQIPRLGPLAPAGQAPDGAVQSSAPTGRVPAATSFAGLANSDNAFAVLPPDTNGDVGPNHYVQFVNLVFAIYSKTGTRLYGPADGSTLWTGFGGPCELDNDGDPIVLYDPISNRWLFSQFALPNYPSGPFYQCLAVSTTADPTGSYNRYEFKFSDTLMNDYPKFGVWPDGYYMSVVQFDDFGDYAGTAAVVFDRAAMVAGNAAQAVSFDLGSATNPMLPADLDGPISPPAGAPNYFGELIDGASTDQLKLWAFHVDWATPTSSTFTLSNTLTPASFNTNIAWIDEPGQPDWLDAIADRPMYRLAYRNFGPRQALVMNHTVNVSGHAGVRWYELRKTTGAWSIFQQGTFSPSADSRWMGSAAMDRSGDIAVGYSVSSSSVNPAIRYAGRRVSDPLGALSQGEATMQAGGGVETSPYGRWGDYSNMSVDPADDCTFWYTTEYFAATSDRGWRTRIGRFKFPSCGVPVVGGFNPTSGAPGASVTINGSDFTGATAVKFNGVAASFSVGSDAQITATVPPGATTGQISVTTPRGTGTSTTSFTVTSGVSLPTISGFSPGTGPVGSSVAITGTNFSGITSVTLRTVSTTFTVNSPTSITAQVPVTSAPDGKWRVTNAAGTATSTGVFYTTATPAPTITGQSLSSGPVGSTVILTGTNFTGATSVTLRLANATFTVNSPTKITATVPVTSAPDGRWRVTTAGGTAVGPVFITTS